VHNKLPFRISEGGRIVNSIAAILDTGSLPTLEALLKDPLVRAVADLSQQHGIGYKKAAELYGRGITCAKDLGDALKKDPKLLNAAQTVGWRYRDEFKVGTI